MVSAFLRLEGNTVRNRIWSFLFVHEEFDYSMKEIAKYAEVSYAALKEILKDFIKRELVIHTRDVGNAKMFRLNLNNVQVITFRDYYWSVVDSEAKKELEEDEMEKEVLVKHIH
ncbi:MAG: hypothetical protein ABIG89_06595 [Candidatus Woesearchaeota archaeon]